MSLWSAQDAAGATGGQLRGDWTACGVSIDTRTLQRGELFVALSAARDGHEFVARAFEKGAAAALVSHVPEDVPDDAPLLIVEDVLKALEDLGRAARTRTRARIIAVTGSVGKTSTKEMLKRVFSGQGKTHAAEASYNNHWGVPLTLARMPKEADFAILEIGMNHPGEIAPLARMARPHLAIITCVAAAHLEAFENLAGIAQEKAAIFEGLEPGGTAIVNGDGAVAPILMQAARAKADRVISFGMGKANHHRLLDVTLGDKVTIAQARAWRTPLVYKIGVPGRHFAINALAVLAAVQAMQGDRAVAISDLARWRPPEGRGTREILQLDIADERLTVDLMDDAFNANPSSMAAALEVLAAAKTNDGVGRVGAGRRIAVLGDMLELGQESARLHAELARLPAIGKIDLIHCVGPLMETLWQALPDHLRGEWVREPEALTARISRLIDAGDVILIKGSKSSRVSMIAEALRRMAKGIHGEEEDI